MTSRPVGQEGHCFLVVAFALFEKIKFWFSGFFKNVPDCRFFKFLV